MLLDAKKFNDVVNSTAQSVEMSLHTSLKEKALPEIKDIILDKYSELALYRMHKDSKLHLKDFYSDLEELLEEQVRVDLETGGGEVKLVVPDIEILETAKETLKVLQVIAEGLAGRYVEITEKERGDIGLSASNAIGFVINNKPVYLYRRTNALLKAMKAAGVPIRRWPFSKPEDIFADANEFVDDNISIWVKEAIEKAQTELKQEYK
jgi:hypothetical protein